MDARDLSEHIFKKWQEVYPKDSGAIHKSLKAVPVVVWTEHGYRQVIGVTFNHLGIIELQLDEE